MDDDNTWWIFRRHATHLVPLAIALCFNIWIAWETRNVVFRNFYHPGESLGIIYVEGVANYFYIPRKMWKIFHLAK